jgi:raffinose/stachyose/melibiose transport system substrate-binding protein
MTIEMSRRRLLGATGTAALTAAALAACGKSSGSDSSSSTAPLELFNYDSTVQAAMDNQVLTAFQKTSKIKTTLDTLPGSGAAIYPSKLRTEILGGKPPDVFRMWGGSIAAPFVTSHQVVDLTPYYAQYGWSSKLSKPNIADMTYDGTKYGVPLYASAVGIWYSTALLKKADVAAPTTYDELETANAALVKAGVQPWLAGGQFGWDVMRFFEYFLEMTAGPTEHDKLRNTETSWNTSSVVQAFALLQKWADMKWLPDGVMGLDPNDVEDDFVGGKGAMALDGQWIESSIVAAKMPASSYGTMIPPTGHSPERFSGFTEGLFITKGSKHPAEAAALINFFTKPSSQETLQNAYTTVTAVPSAKDYPGTAQWKTWLATHPHYVIQDQSLSTDAANAYFAIQSDVVQGRQTPADAASAMQKAIVAAKSSS